MASTKQKQAEARAARRNSEQPNPYSDLNMYTINLYGETLNSVEIFTSDRFNADEFVDVRAKLAQQMSGTLALIEDDVRLRASRGQDANAVRLFMVSSIIADLYANDWQSFTFNGQRGDATIHKVMTGVILSYAIAHITDKPCDLIINMPVEKADGPFENGDEYKPVPGAGTFIMLRDKNLRLLAHYSYNDEQNYNAMVHAAANPDSVH